MQKIRTVIFTPYVKGQPRFTLTLFDTYQSDRDGKSILAYELHQTGNARSIFQGDDFHCSPLHGIDSDETVKALMSFLTLRRGDTDPEYFDNYTQEQIEFSEQHAESLSSEVYQRFGE